MKHPGNLVTDTPLLSNASLIKHQSPQKVSCTHMAGPAHKHKVFRGNCSTSRANYSELASNWELMQHMSAARTPVMHVAHSCRQIFWHVMLIFYTFATNPKNRGKLVFWNSIPASYPSPHLLSWYYYSSIQNLLPLNKALSIIWFYCWQISLLYQTRTCATNCKWFATGSTEKTQNLVLPNVSKPYSLHFKSTISGW